MDIDHSKRCMSGCKNLSIYPNEIRFLLVCNFLLKCLIYNFQSLERNVKRIHSSDVSVTRFIPGPR